MNASGGFRLPHGSERVFFIVDGNYLELLYWGYNKLVSRITETPSARSLQISSTMEPCVTIFRGSERALKNCQT